MALGAGRAAGARRATWISSTRSSVAAVGGQHAGQPGREASADTTEHPVRAPRGRGRAGRGRRRDRRPTDTTGMPRRKRPGRAWSPGRGRALRHRRRHRPGSPVKAVAPARGVEHAGATGRTVVARAPRTPLVCSCRAARAPAAPAPTTTADAHRRSVPLSSRHRHLGAGCRRCRGPEHGGDEAGQPEGDESTA